MVQPLWKMVWSLLKKLKIEPPHDPAIALLGIYPKDIDVVERRAICTSMFIAAMTTIAKLWKEPRCSSTDEWVKMMWHIYNAILLTIRNDEYLPLTWALMELEGIMLSEISQAEKDNYHMVSLTCET